MMFVDYVGIIQHYNHLRT